MLVKYWMSKPAITIDVDDGMNVAIARMKENDIRRLPVMKKNELVGIITDRDLKRASASDATSLDIHELLYLISRIKIKDVMTKNLITLHPDFSIDETAKLFLKNKISGAPVVNDRDELTGVITQTDLFRVLTTLTGVDASGLQFGLVVSDRPGAIKTVTDIIRDYDGRLVSLLTAYENAPEGCRNLYIRAYQIDRSRLPRLQEDLKKAATINYVIDHRLLERTIFNDQS